VKDPDRGACNDIRTGGGLIPDNDRAKRKRGLCFVRLPKGFDGIFERHTFARVFDGVRASSAIATASKHNTREEKMN
jgi:hypothetical protein